MTRSLSKSVELVSDPLSSPHCPGSVLPFQAHRPTGSPSGKPWKRPDPDRQAGSRPRKVDLHFKGGTGFNLHTVSSRQWLNTSCLCLLAHPDRHGVILVVNKNSPLFDGGGGDGAPGSHQQRSCFCCRQCWLLGAGGGACPHLASVTMLPENVLVPPLPGTGQNWKFWAPRLG